MIRVLVVWLLPALTICAIYLAPQPSPRPPESRIDARPAWDWIGDMADGLAPDEPNTTPYKPNGPTPLPAESFDDAVSRVFSMLNRAVAGGERTDVVSREWSLFNARGPESVGRDAISREIALFNKAATLGAATNAVSREFTLVNTDMGLARASDAVSREFSMFNVRNEDEAPDDAVAREFSLFNGRTPATVTNVVSRELSLFNGESPDAASDAISREFSLYRPGPDLQVAGVTAPTAADIGSRITIEWTGRNAGGQFVSAQWVDRIYISTDTTAEPDEERGGASFSGTLLAGETYDRTATIQMPAAPGNYFIIVVADADGQIFEDEFETNNEESRPITVNSAALADLTISALTPPAIVIPGQEAELAWTIANGGAATAVGPWFATVFGVLNGESFPLANYSYQASLEPGESVARSERVPVPGNIPPGQYEVRVCVDTAESEYGDVLESNEENNCRTEPVCVDCLQPDLVITGLVAPALGFDGQTVELSWTVENAGAAAATAPWVDYVYLSENTTGGDADDALVGQRPRSESLDADGASYIAALDVQIPAGIDGDRFFVIRTDALNQVSEPGGELNNLAIAQAPTTITQLERPNLVVSEVSTLEQSQYQGRPVNLTWTVENLGPGTATSAWVDRAYLSDDELLDPNEDHEVCNRSFSGTLQPGSGFYVRTCRFDLPRTFEGPYWLLVASDADGQLTEDGEADNVTAYPIEVLAPEYTATIATDVVEQLSDSTNPARYVQMNGNATAFSGGPAANVPVSIRIRNRGTRRVISVLTDSSGAFSYVFRPLPQEAGFYRIWAEHPAVDENLEDPQDTFVLHRLRVSSTDTSLTLRPGNPATARVTLTNLADVEAAGISVIAEGAPASIFTTVGVDQPQLAGGASTTITATFSTPDLTPIPDPLRLRVFQDVGAESVETATVLVRLFVNPNQPRLVVPATVTADMVRGEQTIVPFRVTNDGGAPATNVQVRIPCAPNPDEEGDCLIDPATCIVDPEACDAGLWLNLVTPRNIGTILPGESRMVELALTPSQLLALGSHPGRIVVQAAETFRYVDFDFTALSANTVDVRVFAQDERYYYYFPEDGPTRVAGASVRLLDLANPGSSPIVLGATNLEGSVLGSQIREGYYQLEVTHPTHGPHRSTVLVRPQADGGVQNIEAFLPSQTVTYTWTVTPTQIPDVYEFNVDVDFQTDVPVPVVTVWPALAELDDLEWSSGDGLEMASFDLTVANDCDTCFIAAEDVELLIADTADYDFEPLITLIGTLPPRESVTIPVQVVRSPAARGGSNCAQFTAGVRWSLLCDIKRWYWVPVYFRYPTGECPQSRPAGGGSPGGSGGGSGPSDPYVQGPSWNTETDCDPPPLQKLEDAVGGCPKASPDGCCVTQGAGGASNPGAGGLSGGETTSQNAHDAYDTGEFEPVYLFSGEWYHETTDLRIPGRGMDFIWARKYRSRIGPDTAQGNGWDYSYNVSLSREGTSLLLRNGDTRADVFTPQPDGTWGRDEFFFHIERNADTSYSVVFASAGRWNFHPFDTSAIAGKLTSISDRNGNTISLEYDALGRLERIIDTLDRPIAVEYTDATADAMIAAVVDFAGREVHYEYYSGDANDPGGNAGDLKSCTSPVVVGTPTGNDFPNGQTISYTYTTGFDDDRLNSNLLTITDARRNDPNDPTFGAGPSVVNVYAHTLPDTDPRFTLDPNDRNFDRIMRQVWGGDVVDVTYVPQTPSTENANSVMKSIVNDRNGNVREYEFDLRNRLVRSRHYTGRADPTLPTGVASNRPTAPLRDDDPAYFATRLGWNNDSLLSSITHPNGNVTDYVYQSEVDLDGPRRARGNLREVRRLPGVHTPVGDQSMLVESFDYDPDFGACCGFNFVTRHVDARNAETLHEYDDRGNRTRTTHRIASIVEDFDYNEFGQLILHTLPDNGSGHRRRDAYRYYTPEDGAQYGYLKSHIVDANNLALTTTYEYDDVGNVVRMIDPRGADTLYVVNQLNQVVRELSRETNTLGDDGAPIGRVRYQRDMRYDANRNLTRIDVQNVNDQGMVVATNPDFMTTFEYEILDNLVRKTEEVDPTRSIVTEYAYDGNRNRTLIRNGEATSGAQPTNTVSFVYDERNLLYQRILAEGDPQQSAEQYDYDENGNRIAAHEGIGLDPDHPPYTTRYIVDAYNRPVRMIDATGNITTTQYDQNGNRIAERVDGELNDIPGSAGNVRLSETTYGFDPMDRLARVDEAFFDTHTQEPLFDGFATTRTIYSDTSQVLQTINDNDHATTITYDTANRRHIVTDAKNNTVEYQYDDNSNVRFVVETEVHDLPDRDPEVFTTEFRYDALDRQLATIDNIGNTNRAFYDSRSNRTRTIDALDHEILYQFDGLNRLFRTIRDMDGSGFNSANPAAFAGDPDLGTENIVTEQGWDDSSRLVTQTDDNGNTTTYVFDPLGRKIADVYADNTRKDFTLDAHGNIRFWTDGNRNEVTQTFDDNDRLIRRDVVPGPGVSDDTTFEVYRYDGMSRLTWAEDDDTLVTRRHDSLSRVTRETQDLYDHPAQTWPTAVVTCVYDAVGNEISLTYPSGRVITTAYDALERTQRISDSTEGAPELIADSWYVGPHRLSRTVNGNGTQTDWTYNGIEGIPNAPGDFGVRQITEVRHSRNEGIDELVKVSGSWDPVGNRKSILRSDFPSNVRFTYDSAHRLASSIRSNASGVDDATHNYLIDGAANRLVVTGPSTEGPYQMTPEDRSMNRYTVGDGVEHTHDRGGNVRSLRPLSSSDELRAEVSYASMLVEGHRSPTPPVRYTYDALKRLVARGSAAASRSVYFGFRELEQGSAEHIYGYQPIVPLVTRGAALTYYLHVDHNLTVLSLSGPDGQIVERNDYSDFGIPTVYDDTGSAHESSPLGNRFLSSGYRWEHEIGLFNARHRFISAQTARFISQDPLGTWADQLALGSSYAFAGHNPASQVDIDGFKTMRFVSKSYIDWNITINGPREIVGGFLAAVGSWDSRPASDSMDSDYRLFSEVSVDAWCCGDNDLSLGKPRARGDTGPELFGLLAVEEGHFIPGPKVVNRTPSSATLTWRFLGRPNPRLGEFGLNAVFWPYVNWLERPSYIWHEVLTTIYCRGRDVREVTQFGGSGFPTHVLFINGEHRQTIPQGPFTNLSIPSAESPAIIK